VRLTARPLGYAARAAVGRVAGGRFESIDGSVGSFRAALPQHPDGLPETRT
jgi:hypothetical protein